jgi:hypothetical protein
MDQTEGQRVAVDRMGLVVEPADRAIGLEDRSRDLDRDVRVADVDDAIGPVEARVGGAGGPDRRDPLVEDGAVARREVETIEVLRRAVQRRELAVDDVAELRVEAGVEEPDAVVPDVPDGDLVVLEERDEALDVVLVGVTEEEVVDGDGVAGLVLVQAVLPDQEAERQGLSPPSTSIVVPLGVTTYAASPWPTSRK